jgi:hypothetical protein
VSSKWKIAGITILATAAAGAVVALIVRDQISRHQRNLFSTSSLRRLAALAHMARESATVDNIRLLRDFVAWEPRKLLRERAKAVLQRMELEAMEGSFTPDAGTA